MAARSSFFFLQMAVVLALLVTGSVGILNAEAAEPQCDTVYGVQPGDTCFSVIEASKLTESFFLGINPNINCDKIFVGQWLCVAGIKCKNSNTDSTDVLVLYHRAIHPGFTSIFL
ncbi:hypothetical protein CRG98_025475 [Punica granatum]|uniref:LysM domain-containing protein n=1 Tax=Punica granatum TaxID=22663 RepID=A0A2I0JDQ2_PUNGR|nr:hypothetical protein CRG98_025475 [Punica granatum]